MDTLFPFLDVSGPDGQHFRVELEKEHVTIGRFDLYNDIALDPDPQHFVTRKVHCFLERDAIGWWVVDNNSRNPPLVQKDAAIEMVVGRALLEEGDSILILGKMTEAGEPIYWKLTFSDPLGTQPAGLTPQVAHLEYDWIQARLFRVDGTQRQEIRELRPQEHKLIRYMEQRNRENGNVPVMCATEELIAAIWGEEPLHEVEEVNHLVWELRRKLEPNPREPRFLETVRGLGYRLITRPVRK